MNILVTGGAGYIGAHTVVELQNAGHEVVVIDNLSNSSENMLQQVSKITGKKVTFHKVDIRDSQALDEIMKLYWFDCCVHFAGLKAVGESVMKPLAYYQNNVAGTLTLLETLSRHGCANLIFSSSATVYGQPKELPITEACPTGGITNPYGWTKCMIEQILMDLHKAEPAWNVALLRYFNPAGAHESGLIGERPRGIPTNLMPYIARVAAGRLPELQVFGNDYDTGDGTGVRDYIHVVDLALGHVKALRVMEQKGGLAVYNLGRGEGCSVLEMVHAFEQANEVAVPYVIKARRPGDVAACYADPSKAERELGWKARLSIEDMCRSAWQWQKNQGKGSD